MTRADDLYHPIGPPDRFEVDVRPVADYVVVQAALREPWRRNGKVEYAVNWFADGGGKEYVNPPNALSRWLGDSFERRIERAKARVTRWAKREIRRRRIAHQAAERGRPRTGDG